MLHNFVGTAAYFGESEFGTTASRLEQVVAGAFTARLLTPLCAEILAALAQHQAVGRLTKASLNGNHGWKADVRYREPLE
jgi:hypothetical protein